jgi:malonate-semialdehyde dehydrogenase (acetylating)/methylmalonate-semialdehyde dehydrogenase
MDIQNIFLLNIKEATIMKILKDYINGQWVEGTGEFIDVYNPSTGEVIAKVPVTTEDKVEEAIKAANEAFKAWKEVPLQKRVGYLFKLRDVLIERKEELAQIIATDQAKTIADARGEVDRGIQNTEVACGLPLMMRGDKIAINGDLDGEIIREPIGVVGGLAPYNFPSLIFGWFVPFALGTGNTLVYKASEQSPMFMQEIAQILEDIGIPAGVFNLINGDKPVVTQMLESKGINAMAFVGSSKVGQIVAEGCAKTNKKAMVLAGAKNTMIVAKDANLKGFADNFKNACFGAAGQRCMAAANVAVEEEIYDKVKEVMLEVAKSVKVGNAVDESTYMGPVISPGAIARIHNYIDIGLEEGCTLLLDGRNPELPEEFKNGYFIAPTILEGVTPDMRVAKEEIFGPVVTLIKIKSYKDGMKIINDSEYGNGGCLFTESAIVAQDFLRHTNSGMIGVNVGVPASMPYLPFGGTKASLMGGQYKAQITDCVEFFTKRKACTIRYYGPNEA